ncbi:hypothetical protein [Geopsychrobacter electrodiphilus]|uniref:hypothetical protein n=1 Tax=Geopsychrobacter electrodiphilus TaxID=225196 RepID=UPI00036C256F|nr:hypothetical protein [Geopsychrobacter electrodiphilus]
MAAMVSAYRRLIIGLVGQKLHVGGTRLAVTFLQDLLVELTWNISAWIRVGTGPGFFFSKINMSADQCSP